MFGVLEGLDNFSKWISDGPIGWIILNPLLLSIMVTIVIVVLHEYYVSDYEEESLTKFAVYSFLIVFIPVMINNNVIDRKQVIGSFEMSEDDFIVMDDE